MIKHVMLLQYVPIFNNSGIDRGIYMKLGVQVTLINIVLHTKYYLFKLET